MGSLLVLRQQLLNTKRDEHLANRQAMLMIPEVQSKLSLIDTEIANAGVELPVRKYTDQELIKKTSTMIKFLCIDLGIVNQTEQTLAYTASRFMKQLKIYYSDLSIKEIKMAFELAVAGELDDWLPKDKNGKPDNKHYNSFNMEYYNKILRAFKAKKGRVWHSISKSVPKLAQTISKEERIANNKVTLQEIIDAFDNYKDNQQHPRFYISLFIEELVSRGLINKVRPPLKSTKDKVYRNLVLKERGNDRRKLIDDFYSNTFNQTLENEAQRLQNNLDIVKLFDKLISEHKHIKDLLEVSNG